jgi:hypothetical protein
MRNAVPTGTASRPVFFGSGGRPDSAATMGTREIAFAGREAAK